jgi:hypothetical protein
MSSNANHGNLQLAIKARVVDDLETMEEKIFNFSQTIGHVAHQEDIYFQCAAGQLKLRLTNTSKVFIATSLDRREFSPATLVNSLQQKRFQAAHLT